MVLCLSGGGVGTVGPPRARSGRTREGGGVSSKSSRLLDLRACSLSLKCFFLIISAKRVVSCIAGASRGFLVPELLRDLGEDWIIDVFKIIWIIKITRIVKIVKIIRIFRINTSLLHRHFLM